MTLPTADSPYGEWSEDDAGLPCFDLDPEARADPDAPLEHLLSTGVMTALVNRWGDLRLMTCAGGEGQKALRPSRWMCASDLLVNAVVDGELHSLLPGQLDKGRRARWGTGYARFHGTLKRTGFAAEFTQELIAPWDDSAGIHGRFAVRNLGQRPIELTLRVCAQVAAVPEAGSVDPLVEGGEGWVRAAAAHPSLGDVILVGPDGWAPSREHVSLVLSRACRLEAGEEVRFHAWLGCTPGGTSADIGLLRDQARSLEPARERMEWAERLARDIPGAGQRRPDRSFNE